MALEAIVRVGGSATAAPVANTVMLILVLAMHLEQAVVPSATYYATTSAIIRVIVTLTSSSCRAAAMARDRDSYGAFS